MRMLLAGLMIAVTFAAYAQSSGGGGSSGGSSGGGSGNSLGGGGSSGSAKTERAPSGTMRTGPNQSNPGGGSAVMGGGSSNTLGAPSDGTAPGSSGSGGQQALVPDLCKGPVNDPSCAGIGEPTGTGLGDRGIGRGPKDRYGPEDSPVKGGPSFDGPTGRPLDLPNEGR